MGSNGGTRVSARALYAAIAEEETMASATTSVPSKKPSMGEPIEAGTFLLVG